ncbi:uncharacterized protein [Diadema antillarum]|uniref:uncharacterized protein n=1 Tax=Diadema antillarum TaxID=105358 RepID=UPI003A888886
MYMVAVAAKGWNRNRTGTEVAGLLKLPPFWSSDPAVWFAQVEATFDTKRIVREKTRCPYVISSLQPEVAMEIRDLIVDPPSSEPYTKLKTELIRRMSISELKRLNKLLISEELGDRTPSQLLRRMQQHLGDKTLEPSMLRHLFVQRLPENVQLILASTSETMDINEAAALADRILEVAAPSSVASVEAKPAISTPTASAPDDVQHLIAQVAQLTAQVQALIATVKEGHRSRNRSSSRSRRSSCSRSESPIPQQRHPESECWYHWSFGEKAKRCTPPCSWHKRHPSSTPGNQPAGN